MIHAVDLCKTYPSRRGSPSHTALQDNLTVDKGDIFGIIGRSGAGKSTLLRTINGLERPTVAGSRLRGRTFSHFRNVIFLLFVAIGMVFQHFNVLSSRTVYENVALPLEFSGQSGHGL